MLDEPLRVTSCPLCKIFINKQIKTKLYWPQTIDEIPNTEFVVLDSDKNGIPMIVYGEHITELTNEAWGRILYRCRILFGGTMRLRTRMYTYRDHWHAMLDVKKV